MGGKQNLHGVWKFMHVCVSVCVSVLRVCGLARILVCVCVCVCVCVFVSACACACGNLCMCAFRFVCLCFKTQRLLGLRS